MVKLEAKELKFYIICERDVGLFSLIQSVVSHLVASGDLETIPIAYFRNKCCYFTDQGFMGSKNVWEYYFEPLENKYRSDDLPAHVLDYIRNNPPHHLAAGYIYKQSYFITSNFGDHKDLRNQTLVLPYKWKDPDLNLRQRTSHIIQKYVRPRIHLCDKFERFYNQQMKGKYIIGLHIRASDVRDKWEHNIHRRNSYSLKRYIDKINMITDKREHFKIFLATDTGEVKDLLSARFPDQLITYSTIYNTGQETTGHGPEGWKVPKYLTEQPEIAAENGEEAIIDYLLLSRSNVMVHNGSSLARTVLLKEPELLHYNVHSLTRYLKIVLNPFNGEWFYLLVILCKRFGYWVKSKLNVLNH
jgi:Nodulation protein Z (NodZ).